MEFSKGIFTMDEETYQSLSEDMVGLCIACGDECEDNLEPDARNIECDSCGKNKVFGIEELLLMGKISFIQ